jgi:hypothetical protein
MPLPKDQAWFPAKRYGYGWSFPRRWQGWAVMLGYFAALAGAKAYAQDNVALLITCVSVLTAAIIAICIWKGEAAGWRWGKD